MSIPPLVCSTPPPPDQCEDDKDTEDYDLQYHLSQDDEDDNYDFGHFSSLNHFQSSQNKTDPVIGMSVEMFEDDDSSKHTNSSENDAGTNIISKSKAEIIEEHNVEDLDLNLEHNTLQKDDDSKKSEIEIKAEENMNLHTTDKNDLNSSVQLESTSQIDEFVELPSLEKSNELPSYVDEIIASVDNCDMTPAIPELTPDFPEDIEPKEELSSSVHQENKLSLPTIETEIKNSEIETSKQEDDDFGDFDDFQSAAPIHIEKPATLETPVNPWENNTADEDFGDFKASFDEGESNSCSKNDNSFTEIGKSEEIEKSVEPSSAEAEVDDDFGDFDDFKSSSVEATTSIDVDESEDIIPQFPMLNLQDTDEQIMENINNVVNFLYGDELKEPTEEFDVKLESLLGVTWGHLLAVDERQPYIVNWNNSLGQKTLLKALCIDSRNILFGPKWNQNMPKYAATLSVAPLQPQKQATSSMQAEPLSQDMAAGNSGTTWSDPFSSDGKESTYAETLLLDLEHLMATLDQMAHSHSSVKISELLSNACKPEPPTQNPVIEIGPTDLDVFEASTSSKPDKIFSSTISVQPIRQISLPDTHIFTPTDSETPRSTTIHYDNSPTVILPQSVIESKSEPSFKTERTSPRPSTSTADDDYWEFQDFKGASIKNTIPPPSIPSKQSETLKSDSNITYATQVLQPIKVEPMMPTLNWPDPGEVKETFDDFSDFVSSTSSSNQPTPIVPVSQIDNKTLPELPGSSRAAPNMSERIAGDASGDFDDGFDTFQSALPAENSLNARISSASGGDKVAVGAALPTASPQAMSSQIADFDFAFPKNKNDKSESISFEIIPKPKDALQSQSNFFPNSLDVEGTRLQTTSTSMVTGLLQPMPVSSIATMQNQQKSGQILQPLSLESFSQINWPNPGIDLQDLSRFNPVETLHSLKSDLSVNSQSKVGSSPVHGQKSAANNSNQAADDDWGEFVSSKPQPAPAAALGRLAGAGLAARPVARPAAPFAADDDEWTDFVSSTSVKPPNGLNTISFNVHTNTYLTNQKPNSGKFTKKSQLPVDIPTLNYITPKSTNHKTYKDRHLNL